MTFTMLLTKIVSKKQCLRLLQT